jgi:hypothetical protein
MATTPTASDTFLPCVETLEPEIATLPDAEETFGA